MLVAWRMQYLLYSFVSGGRGAPIISFIYYPLIEGSKDGSGKAGMEINSTNHYNNRGIDVE